MEAVPTKVSVVIPTKNRSALLSQALASVRALEGDDLRLEIIVADNDSTDDTEAVANSWGATIVHATTPGASAARNAGLRAVTGEFIAFLDDDDVWLPGHLRPHIELLRARPNFGGAIGQVLTCDQDLASPSAPWPASLPDDGDLFASFLGLCPQIGATVVRASARESVGYLDEALRSDEDWDWHLRLALAHRMGFLQVPCLLFRERSPGARDELQWMRLAYNRQVFWTNVWRAGSRRPPIHNVMRRFLEHNGAFSSRFLQDARAYATAGNLSGTRRAVGHALCSSPLHTIKALATDISMQRIIVTSVRRHYSSKT
jgi:glycosyltransferase involved in cell wall biosynthesis